MFDWVDVATAAAASLVYKVQPGLVTLRLPCCNMHAGYTSWVPVLQPDVDAVIDILLDVDLSPAGTAAGDATTAAGQPYPRLGQWAAASSVHAV